MSVLSVVLEFFSSIIGRVLADVLKTPAIENTVEKAEGILPTTATDNFDKYKWMRDRG